MKAAAKALPDDVRQGIEAARKGKYLAGLTLLGNFYDQPGNPEKIPDGLSWYGFCVAAIDKNYEHAVECCKVALERQPANPTHYLNLTKIHLASGNRKKAVETADQGLSVKPNDAHLLELRQQLGVRGRPAVSFLDRGHPVNVAIGQVRHATKKKIKSKRSPKT